MAQKSFLSDYADAWTRKHGKGGLGALTMMLTGAITLAVSVVGGLGYVGFIAPDNGDWGKAVSDQERNAHLKTAGKLETLNIEKRNLDAFILTSQSPQITKTFGNADPKKIEAAKKESAALDAQLKKQSKLFAERILMSQTLSEEATRELLFKHDYGVMPLGYGQEWQKSFNEKHSNMIQECRMQFPGATAESGVPAILACAHKKTAQAIVYNPLGFGTAGWLTASLGLPFVTAAGAYTRRRREEKENGLIQQTVSLKVVRKPDE